ncbi:hypothetical protein TrRE_jg8714, partial [Triparma retinervis]
NPSSPQLLLLPFISVFTPLKEVQKAARIPSIIASVLQVINGLVFIGEGVMQGCGDFLTLALSNVAACGGMMCALPTFVNRWGLKGVWASFGIFNGIRLMGVAYHQAIGAVAIPVPPPPHPQLPLATLPAPGLHPPVSVGSRVDVLVLPDPFPHKSRGLDFPTDPPLLVPWRFILVDALMRLCTPRCYIPKANFPGTTHPTLRRPPL